MDLITRKLYADVATYPNQFGACREDRYDLTASEFHQKATAFNMSEELQYMETDADWESLFDENLKSAIMYAQKRLEEQHKKKIQEQQILNAVVIPDKFATIEPKMVFDEILIELRQRYGTSSVLLTKESEKYVLMYCYSATYSSNSKDRQRKLSPLESAWVEQQVNNCITNQDETTWQSVVGGDMMTVRICAQNKPQIEFRNEVPQKKYLKLQHLLQNLTIYGSFTEKEIKKIKK